MIKTIFLTKKAILFHEHHFCHLTISSSEMALMEHIFVLKKDISFRLDFFS